MTPGLHYLHCSGLLTDCFCHFHPLPASEHGVDHVIPGLLPDLLLDLQFDNFLPADLGAAGLHPWARRKGSLARYHLIEIAISRNHSTGGTEA